MPFQKVPHRKVRTGCDQCKRRRIKVQDNPKLNSSLLAPALACSLGEQCDETKPSCANCARYTSSCSYSLRRASTDGLSGATHLDASGNIQSSFSFADFELLHHWTLATAESLAANASLQRIMREVVPVLAMKHRYLMWATPTVSLQVQLKLM
jgi:hypothetical protein